MRPRRAIAACREARIEWFSGNSNHDGAIFTRSDFRSQALCQHSTQDITSGTPHIPFNIQAASVLKQWQEHPVESRQVVEVSVGSRRPDRTFPMGRTTGFGWYGPASSPTSEYDAGLRHRQPAGWKAWDGQCLSETAATRPGVVLSPRTSIIAKIPAVARKLLVH